MSCERRTKYIFFLDYFLWLFLLIHILHLDLFLYKMQDKNVIHQQSPISNILL